jgi:precorrin-8X/cobalt-precorrin-8 methylmutase
MHLAAARHPRGAVWVVGTAPSALAELLELHRRGTVEPLAVVGLPVGFVGAPDAKRALWNGPLRRVAITNAGERGGSAAAAAVLNAIDRLHRTSRC